MTHYTRGLWAERWGMMWLRLKGYKILAHRYRTPVGEVDIIARRGALIICVEVKYRASFDEGLNAITPKQQQRIKRASSLFLARYTQKKNIPSGFQVRFDILLVVKYKLWHLENYWGHDVK